MNDVIEQCAADDGGHCLCMFEHLAELVIDLFQEVSYLPKVHQISEHQNILQSASLSTGLRKSSDIERYERFQQQFYQNKVGLSTPNWDNSDARLT